MNSSEPVITPDSERAPGSYLPGMAKGAMINLSGAFTRTVILYIYTLLLARFLSPADLGKYFLMFTVMNILSIVSVAGMDNGVVRYVARYAGENNLRFVRRTLGAGLVFGLICSLGIAILVAETAPWIAQFIFNGDETAILGLRIFSLSIPFWVAARLFNSTTQGLHKMQFQVYSRDFGEQSSKLILSVLLLLLGVGIIGVVWANVASLVIAAVLSLIFVLRAWSRPEAGRPPAVKERYRPWQLYRYSLPLAFSNILAMVLVWIDMILMGYFGTPDQVGFYGAAIRVSAGSAAILLSFSTVFAPIISDLHNRGQKQELTTLFSTITRWVFVLSLPVFLLLVIFSDPVMRLFGSEFAVGGVALVILAAGQLVNAATGPAGFMVLMSGHSRVEVLNVFAALLANVILCVILIPRYGVIGAALANMFSAGVINVLRAIEVWIFLRLQAYNRSYLTPVLAGAIASVAVIAVSRVAGIDSTGFSLLVLAPLLLIIYLAIMLVYGLSSQDRDVLRLVKSRLGLASTV